MEDLYMITKHEYTQAKRAFYDFNLQSIDCSSDIVIGDYTINRYSCIQFHNDICKFLIFVLYIAPKNRSYHDFERVIEFINKDLDIGLTDKGNIHI